MGWFESQIEERRRADDARLDIALRRLSDAVTGGHTAESGSSAERAATALDRVLAYYGVEPSAEPPSRTATLTELIRERLRSTGIMSRPVRLTGAWWKDAMGAMLGFDAEGEPVALVPGVRGGYERVGATGRTRVGERSAAGLREEAYCFYRPLPQRELSVKDLLLFMVRAVDPSDYIALALATLAVTLLGLVAPLVNEFVFGPVIAAGDVGVVGPVAAMLAGVLLAQVVIGGVKQIVLSRISTRVEVPLEAAVMMRVLSLPASFFSRWQTGELASRVEMVTSLAAMLREIILTAGFNSLFSLVYVGQIASVTPSLALPALGVLVASAAVTVVVALAQMRTMRRQLDIGTRLSGWQLALLQGIQKIRLAGAEKRAFATWADIYQGSVRLTYNGPVLVRLASAIQLVVSLGGSMLIYACALGGGVSVAQYMSFSVAYGSVTAAFSSLAGVAVQIASVRPYLELVDPILSGAPETSERRPAVTRLSGGFELNNVTFSYREGAEPVLRDFSLKVRPGEYVAVVGKTGCGKSTLLRLLLGFERPGRGAVYYDGHDLSSVDAGSVRSRIGVVLQNGQLFMGTIYENIALSSPGISMQEAWEAAELAGVADDIRAMPMGMRTLLTEGGGGISGGQRQRILIARAVAGKPKILMLDEATSALDNASQKAVSEALDGLRCTRLVIAHRLSTIKNCGRVVVIDGGQIVEDGTYDELLTQGGVFAELVARQQV